jgi:hypothetical protein
VSLVSCRTTSMAALCLASKGQCSTEGRPWDDTSARGRRNWGHKEEGRGQGGREGTGEKGEACVGGCLHRYGCNMSVYANMW